MPTPSVSPQNVSTEDRPRDWLRSVPRRLRGHGRTLGALLLLTAALIAGLTVLGGGTVQADPVPGEVTNLRLSSDAPGELTITWDAPSDAPADYRVSWARGDLSYLSWDAADETHRGNSYPGGAGTSLTLTGLTADETYKVRMRSRYNPGTSNGWSGPWTDEARQRVTAPATPTPVPTAAPTPAPANDEVTNLRLSSDAAGALTITWDAPSSAPADYRVSWARDDLSWLSWDASNETHRGSSYPDGADTSLTLTGLTGGETYKARLRSRYNPGTSEGRSGPWTDEATQRVLGDAPAAPTALSAEETTIKGQTSIALSWTAPSQGDLTGYRIHRGATAGSLTVMVQNTGDTEASYTDATTEADNTYVYAVTALSLDGNSPRSATVSIGRGGGGTTTRDDPPLIISDDEDDENLQFAEQSGSSTVSLVSNLGLSDAVIPVQFQTADNLYDQSFTTGGSSDTRYVLISLTLNLSTAASFQEDVIGVSVYSDAGGKPGTSLYAFDAQTVDSPSSEDITFEGELPLEPNTKYWLRVSSVSSSGQLGSRQGGQVDSSGLSDWSLADYYHLSTVGSFGSVGTRSLAVGLRGVVLEPSTVEPVGWDFSDFSFDASTLGRLRIGETSTGVLDATDDNRSGDLLKIEGLTAGNSYRVRAWFGTSKEDSATAARGGAIGLQFSRAGIELASLSPHNDNLLDDGHASFVFPAFASEDYYVDLVAPAFRPPDGSNPAHTYYGPYMLEIYDLGVTQRLTGVTGQTCDSDNRVCTGGTVTYSEGYGIKASNICVNNRCSNDPRFPEFWYPGYETNETHEVSVGNNPTSKNLSQAVAFRAHDSTGPTAGFKLDRVEVFVHSMTSGSIPQAAIHARNVIEPGDHLFDLEPIYNDDGHLDAFVAPQNAPALNRDTYYFIVFSEGGGDTDSFKLYATAKQNDDDDDAHTKWDIQIAGRTKDKDATSPTWGSMISGDAMSGTNVLIQFSIYAGVAP